MSTVLSYVLMCILFYDPAVVNEKIVVGKDCKKGSWPFGNSGCVKLLRAITDSGICSWLAIRPQDNIAYPTAYSDVWVLKEHVMKLFY